jgi:hypothetical protein
METTPLGPGGRLANLWTQREPSCQPSCQHSRQPSRQHSRLNSYADDITPAGVAQRHPHRVEYTRCPRVRDNRIPGTLVGVDTALDGRLSTWPTPGGQPADLWTQQREKTTRRPGLVSATTPVAMHPCAATEPVMTTRRPDHVRRRASIERKLAERQAMENCLQRILGRADNVAVQQLERATHPITHRPSAATEPEMTRRPGFERATDPVAIRLSAATVPEKTTRRPDFERAINPVAIRLSAATVSEKTTRRPASRERLTRSPFVLAPPSSPRKRREAINLPVRAAQSPKVQ